MKQKGSILKGRDSIPLQLIARRLKAMADPRVVFLGWVYGDLLDELYSSAYLFVLPSETEGLSVSLLEAINFGCGVLVSDIPENLDALREYGFSFKNADVGDLAGVIQHLVDHPEEIAAKRGKGTEYVRTRYGVSPVVDSLESIYREMLGKKGSKIMAGE